MQGLALAAMAGLEKTHHPLPITHYVIAAVFLTATMSGCGTVKPRDTATTPPVARAPDSAPAPARAKPPPAPGGGGYYLNDGPGDNPPANIEQIPDAVPRVEPLRPANMRPYTVMGQTYTPMTRLAPYKERGIASWYGRRYHDQKTSSGEIYDMYGMTAAHTVLPIPSYARVTNLANSKSIVVRVNDRGPFRADRLIDLSYTAAYKLGVLGGGKALVEVETIIPDAGTPNTSTLAAVTPPSAPVPSPATATSLAMPQAPVATPLPAPAAVPPRDEPAATNNVNAEPAAPSPVVAVIAEQKGLFLQLGAFGSQENAENYLTRLRSQVDWLAPALHVYPRDGLFRVHAGPYANEPAARAAADRISQTLGIKPMVLVR